MEEKKTMLIPRLELYRDFIFRVIYYMNKYYLDAETLDNETDITYHFDFIFKKTSDDFEKEGFYFTDNYELKDYIFEYFYEQVYKNNEHSKSLDLRKITNYWDIVFNHKSPVYKNSIIVLTDIYTLFDLSLDAKKNVEIID